jgi:hypothetical protein
MHTKFSILVFNKITRVQPNLLEQKQHELDIKSWGSKTKQKKHQTSSLKSVKTKINEKNQGA